MRRYLSIIMVILWIGMLLYFISRVQDTAESKKEAKENAVISGNINQIKENEKYIAEIEQLNKMLAECQKAEQTIRATNQKARTQIIKIIDEKVSDNPTPADKELLRDLSNLADAIRTERNLDTP